jgi:hypothetical protein
MLGFEFPSLAMKVTVQQINSSQLSRRRHSLVLPTAWAPRGTHFEDYSRIPNVSDLGIKTWPGDERGR